MVRIMESQRTSTSRVWVTIFVATITLPKLTMPLSGAIASGDTLKNMPLQANGQHAYRGMFRSSLPTRRTILTELFTVVS